MKKMIGNIIVGIIIFIAFIYAFGINIDFNPFRITANNFWNGLGIVLIILAITSFLISGAKMGRRDVLIDMIDQQKTIKQQQDETISNLVKSREILDKLKSKINE